MIAFINSRSGGGAGEKLLLKLRRLIGMRQVHGGTRARKGGRRDGACVVVNTCSLSLV